MNRILLCCFVLAGGLLLASGCDDDEDAPQLSTSHPGWNRADCDSCHTRSNEHGGQHAFTECMGCHGPNGQPAYPSGHSTAGCTNCHSGGGAPWNAATHAAYSADADCLACHDL